jgi:hypothetical protein
MLGNVVFNRVLLEAFKPALVNQVMRWMERGKVIKVEKGKKDCVYTIDHPDFLEADPPYDYTLHFRRIYGFDGETYSDHDIVSTLSYKGSDGVQRIVKAVYT